jgi:hypothetical protein
MAAMTRLKALFRRRRSSSSTASSLRGPDGKAVSIVSRSSLPIPSPESAQADFNKQLIISRRAHRPTSDARISRLAGMLTGAIVDPITCLDDMGRRLTDTYNRNAMLVEQAREDAREMHKASKMNGLRKHARKISAKLGGSGKHLFEGDLN